MIPYCCTGIIRVAALTSGPWTDASPSHEQVLDKPPAESQVTVNS